MDMIPVSGVPLKWNCTRCTVNGCIFQGPVSNAAFACISNSAKSKVNCEFHEILDNIALVSPIYPGQGVFLYNGPSYNAKGLVVARNSVSNAFAWVYLANGSAAISYTTGTWCTWGVYAVGWTETLSIDHCHPEWHGGGGGGYVYCDGGTAPVHIYDNCDASEVGTSIVTAGVVSLHMHDNVFSAKRPGVLQVLAVPGRSPVSVRSENNVLHMVAPVSGPRQVAGWDDQQLSY
jgi:hypothetical protein